MSRRDASARGPVKRSPGASEDPVGRVGPSGDDPGADGPGSPAGGPADAGAGVMASALDAKVLVLNRLYVAIRVVSARRAFTLLMREAAEIIDFNDGNYVNYDFESWIEISQLQQQFERERHDWVRTVRFDIAVPRIIRLLGYQKVPASEVKLNRKNLFARDRNRCQYCGRLFPTSELSIDHVVPRTQGGGDTWTNLVCACVRCNAKKGGRTPEQAHMPLVRRPEQPKRNPMISVRLGSPRYESWKAFLDDAYWSVELG